MASKLSDRWAWWWSKLQNLSVRQAVVTFLTGLLLAVSYRRFVLDANNPSKCNALLTQGHWYPNNDHTWLTPGCVSPGYGSGSIHDCARHRKIVFAGDDWIAGTFWAMVHKLDRGVDKLPSVNGHIDYSGHDVEVSYLKDPFMNGTDLFDYLTAFRDSKNSPTIIVIGAGWWYADHDDAQGFEDQVKRISKFVSVSRRMSGVGGHGVSIDDGPGDMIVFAPLQVPDKDDKSKGLHLSGLRRVNARLRQLGDAGLVDVAWSFNEMTKGRPDKTTDHGMRGNNEVTDRQADVLLGLRCNAQRAKNIHYSNTQTCCGTWRGPNWVQSFLLVIIFGVLPALVFVDFIFPFAGENTRPVLRALCSFGLIIGLQRITDRTHLFEQTVRLAPFQLRYFWAMSSVSLLLAVITIRRSPPLKVALMGEKSPDQPFLGRDQSDEWKGWMQLLIITYHYNRGWENNWIWYNVRTVVAAYLFLSGFGHTVFFLQKRDYSLRRFTAVMLRTNLLPAALAYVMDTRWTKYYYMPLSTFWFAVLFATMAIGRKYNDYTPFLLGKIAFSAILVHQFISIRDLPETVVRFFQITCHMDFDAGAFFRYRVYIDQYIVYVGMLVGIFYLWVKGVLARDEKRSKFDRMFARAFPWLKIAFGVLSLVAFVSFWYFVKVRVRSQDRWKRNQPYLTTIPILAFLGLRNSNRYLRNFHSAFFAFCGRYSGEMYVMQAHIWLAGEQEAILRTGLFHGDETVFHDRWRDLLIITPLFLIACSIIGDATAVITTAFITESATPKTQNAPVARAPADIEMPLLGEDDADYEDVATSKEDVRRRPFWKVAISAVSTKALSLLWPNRLKHRVALLLACMWFMNVTYRW